MRGALARIEALKMSNKGIEEMSIEQIEEMLNLDQVPAFLRAELIAELNKRKIKK